MEISYSTTFPTRIQWPWRLLCLLSCLLASLGTQAQSITLQAALGNTLPLQDFGSVQVNRTSGQQSFLVSGANLTGAVTLNPAMGFEIRTGGNAFSTNAILLPSTSGTLSSTAVDVRFAPIPSGSYPNGSGSYADNVVVLTPSGAGIVSQSVAVLGTGQATPTSAYVYVDPASLAFGTVSQSGSDQVLAFVVGGGNLGTTPITLASALSGSAASGTILIRNPAAANSVFATSLTIDPVNGQVPETTIETRINGPIASRSNFTGTITAASGTAVAAPSNLVQVTTSNPFAGSNTSSTFTVSTPPSNPITPGYPTGGQPLQPFNTVPNMASATQAVLVSGSFLVSGITVGAPTNFQVSLDPAFPGLGNGGTGTATSNSLVINPVDGTVSNVLVYIRYVPALSGTESGTGVMFDSAPATSVAAIVQANSIGNVESQTVYTQEGPVVLTPGVSKGPELIRIHAELLSSPLRLFVSGESAGALGNPSGYAQFRLSKDGGTYTDPTVAGASFITLNPDPRTHAIDQDVYVVYAPNRVGLAQAMLQYQTPDITASPSNALTPVVSSFSGSAANKLRGTAVGVEPTRDTPFAATRNTGASSASIVFNPDVNQTGYGKFHMVLISTSATLTTPDIMPIDATDYNSGNGAFQSVEQSTLANTQGKIYYVVYSGGSPTATVTGLNSGTNYYAYVFDYKSTNPSSTTFINNAENYKGPAQTTVFGAVLAGNPLPVELVSVTAQVQGPAAVRLAWATASEKNSAGFTAERSTDGRTFVALARVAGAGNGTAPRTYAFLDKSLPAGAALLYYRLRQTDSDSTVTFSPVRMVAVPNVPVAAQLLVYPNPTHGVVLMRVLGLAPAATVEVYDAHGSLVQRCAAPASDAEAALPLEGLPPGIYAVRCGLLSRSVRYRIRHDAPATRAVPPSPWLAEHSGTAARAEEAAPTYCIPWEIATAPGRGGGCLPLIQLLPFPGGIVL
jgi:hypothetical protein